ncbi:MAG TPA: hypothetical protein VF940_12895 [Streptosporangiaceae bacterium]
MSARGPFSLSASTGFLEGFTPAAFTGTIGQPLELSRSRELGRPPGRVLEHPGGVQCEVISPVAPGPEALAAVRAQVARILSLDVDGSGFPAVGRVVHAFPAPCRLTGLDAFPGLSGRKPEWLRSVAAAALAGRLDAARLRAQPPDQALAQLRQLPGIGDFSAELVLLRGAADPDRIPRHEPRFARAVALAYNLPQPPSRDQLQRISENWRPYRTWVTLLLRTFLEGQTGEITGKPHAAHYLGSPAE